MNNIPALSICIPTYNRIHKLEDTIREILRSDSEKFEIAVLDNCSTDKTIEILTSIKDPRLKIYRNKENIGGMKNMPVSMLRAQGKYAMLLLDKDRIQSKNLSKFIEHLEHKEYSHGYCVLNTDTPEFHCTEYNGKTETLLNTAYLSRHPSGSFFRTEMLMKSRMINVEENGIGGSAYLMDMVNADLCTGEYAAAKVDVQLVFTESVEDAAKVQTHSYSAENLFFTPRNLCKEFKLYFNHLASLKPEKDIYVVIATELIFRYISMQFVSLDMLNQHEILWHYGTNRQEIEKEINKLSIVKYFCSLCWWYLFQSKGAAFGDRLQVMGKVVGIFFGKIVRKLGRK